MTTPHDPYGQHPFTYDPLGRVPYVEPPAQPPALPFPPEPDRPPVNPLATLSLVFAFVFAPVGAVFGHLGLAQIRRTGQRGRDRALAGMTLSYLFIALTVVAVIAWATLAKSPRVAAPPPTATGPPPPTVEPGALATLLPGVDALRTMTGDENLEAGPTRDRAGRSNKDGAVDRAECWGSVAAGTPDAFPGDATTGYHAAKFSDTRSLFKSVEVLAAVVAFRDPPAAAAQLAEVLTGWRRCGGTTVNVTIPDVGPIPYALSTPADAGNGITTMDLAPKGLQVHCARAIAAKSNVVADLSVCSGGTGDGARPRDTAVSIANYILTKLPG